MKKNDFLRRFVLLGIFMFTSYLGFSQTAIFRILSPENPPIPNICFELEYRKVNSEDMINIEIIVPIWMEYEDEEGVIRYNAFYNLTGLESGEIYEVRIRAYIIGDNYEIMYGEWSEAMIIMLNSGENGVWEFMYRPMRRFALGQTNQDMEMLINSKEYKITKEAIKEE